MIVLENPESKLDEFKSLMSNVDALLNREARTDERILRNKGGRDLEPIVCEAVVRCAEGTSFEGTIYCHEKDGDFPDIVAARYYGIEVKSTTKNQWKSIGSSILESTRIKGVGRIFLTFGKLGKPIEFRSRPYEECLYGISVTHYPRYQIDMELASGHTIFDKIKIDYKTLSKMPDPVPPVADFYRNQLKPGESLWWAGNKVEEEDVPVTVKLWTSLTPSEKDIYEAHAYVLFPECIMSRGNKKYSRMVLWLATQKSIINSNVRDSFSAGGKVRMKTEAGVLIEMPAVFNKVKEHIDEFNSFLSSIPADDLQEFWGEPIQENRIEQWISLVVSDAKDLNKRDIAKSVLRRVFMDCGILK